MKKAKLGEYQQFFVLISSLGLLVLSIMAWYSVLNLAIPEPHWWFIVIIIPFAIANCSGLLIIYASLLVRSFNNFNKNRERMAR